MSATGEHGPRPGTAINTTVIDDAELGILSAQARSAVTRLGRVTEPVERRAARQEALDILTALTTRVGAVEIIDLEAGQPDVAVVEAHQAVGALRAALLDEPHTKGRRSRTAALLSGAVLPLGLLAVAFAAYQLWGSDLIAARTQRELTSDLSAALAAASVATTSDGDGLAEPGQPVGALQIAEIGLDVVAVEGTSAAALQRGPGHHRNTPALGHVGNSVVVGRRSSYGRPFEQLNRLEPGDEIVALTPEGSFEYEVDELNVIASGDPAPFEQATGVGVLTLLTSSPKDQDEWLYVRAELQGDPIPDKARPVIAMSDAEFSLQGDRDAWGGILLWGQALAGTWLLRRHLAHVWLRWSTWLITTPLLAVFALLLFESLDRLFPPTL